MQDKFENCLLAVICRRNVFNFSFSLGPMLTEKKPENREHNVSTILNSTFVRNTEKKIQTNIQK